MARIYRLRRNFDDTVEQCKDTQQSDVFTEYMLQLKRKIETRQTNTIQIENRMGRVLMIGAGGVATVAAHKIVQNADTFSEFIIASRRKEKCDALVGALRKKRIWTTHTDSTGGCRRRGAAKGTLQPV